MDILENTQLCMLYICRWFCAMTDALFSVSFENFSKHTRTQSTQNTNTYAHTRTHTHTRAHTQTHARTRTNSVICSSILCWRVSRQKGSREDLPVLLVCVGIQQRQDVTVVATVEQVGLHYELPSISAEKQLTHLYTIFLSPSLSLYLQ